MTLDADCVRVHEIYRAAKRPPLETLSPAEARDAMLRSRVVLQPDPPEVGELIETAAPGIAGPIGLRIYKPSRRKGDTALPVLVYYHGGGWVIGDLDSHDTLCRELCEQAGIAVASVHYRLAPEHAFPAAVDDAYAATAWISQNAASLGFDAGRLAVGGDSAGGNLAAVVALMARDAGGPPVRFQLLIYPAVDAANPHPSHRTRAEVLPLTAAAMNWFKDNYAGGSPTAAADWRMSPLLAKSLTRLPPAYVLTAGYDVLCDEGIAYATRLQAEGVAVEARHMPGMIHGFLTMGRIVKGANGAVTECASALARALK